MPDISNPDPQHQIDESKIGGTYSKYVLMVLVIVYIFNFIDRQILSILAEDIRPDIGITDAEIGFLYGTAFAAFSMLSDYFPPRLRATALAVYSSGV